MLNLSKLAEDHRAPSNGFPGFPTSGSSDLNQLASLYAGGNIGNGLLSAAYGFPSLFSRFYPPANSLLSNSASSTSTTSAGTSSEEQALSRLGSLAGSTPTWPNQPFLPPPPQGLSPLSSSNAPTPPTSSSNSAAISNPMLSSFGSSGNTPFPFPFPPFGIHPFDFSRLPSTVNNENFDLKNFDPRAMLSAYFGAFGSASAPMEAGNVPNPMLPPFGAHTSAQLAPTPAGSLLSTTAAAPVPASTSAHSTHTGSSSNSSSSVSSSSKLNSPVMSTQESKYSPLSLSSLNEQLEQGRDLLQLHETLNQRFKTTSNLSTVTSNSAFGNRFFPYGMRPFLFNGQHNSSSKLNSPNEGDDKLLSPKSDTPEENANKKLRPGSRTSSECTSPARSHSSGRQSGAESECSSPRSNLSQPSSPANFEEKSDKSKRKSVSKESIQELKNMQRMVEGLDSSRPNGNAPTIAAT